jgi:hypothetical protein
MGYAFVISRVDRFRFAIFIIGYGLLVLAVMGSPDHTTGHNTPESAALKKIKVLLTCAAHLRVRVRQALI